MQSDKKPVVSIGMPVFNDKLFLPKAMDSLLAQTYPDFEIIISDDGSTDGSEELCRRYASGDSRIRYIRQEKNLGISRNMEFLLGEAKGTYFMWAANDDVWHPSFIEILKKGLEENSDAAMAFCPMVFIDENNRVLAHPKGNKIDYSGQTAVQRLYKLISLFDDACGYALFVKKHIEGVQFPVWWSVNKTRAFNNIFPPLCYYLSKKNYVLCGNEVLWYNRLKTSGNVHHRVPFPDHFFFSVSANALWKFNLVVESERQIWRGRKNPFLCAVVFPYLFWKWFLVPSATFFGHAFYERYLKK